MRSIVNLLGHKNCQRLRDRVKVAPLLDLSVPSPKSLNMGMIATPRVFLARKFLFAKPVDKMIYQVSN